MGNEITELESAIKEIFFNEFGLSSDELSEETGLFSNSVLDSLDVIRLMSSIEKKFTIKIPVYAVSLEDFDSISKIVILIQKFRVK
ncbi:MAG: acyl carrier protein [Legionellales bacterium]|nr:acyl carrier protein [Legionellales bacterium]